MPKQSVVINPLAEWNTFFRDTLTHYILPFNRPSSLRHTAAIKGSVSGRAIVTGGKTNKRICKEYMAYVFLDVINAG
ncbi:hypothetical protein [Flavobacterium sp. Arc2]|uniref:hypothetical protein n=1 Tax=Flavobacterium sp. Arc2 TaxID=3046685 RepID=UPI00352E57ED